MIGIVNLFADIPGGRSENVGVRLDEEAHAALVELAQASGAPLGRVIRQAVGLYLVALPYLGRLAAAAEADDRRPERLVRLALAAYLDAEEARLGLAAPRAGADGTGAQAATQDALATAPAREAAP